MQRFWMGVGLMLLSAGVAGADVPNAAAKPPEFQPVPVRLSQQRDGLGHVFAKLRAGREVRIAYFGGSITAADGWRPQTLQWFRDTYPQAQIKEINAAIGGTGSDLGVYRFVQDVLAHKPDLIFVEFAVNDGGASPENIWRGMEGIVRQAWRADPTIDICYVYTFHTGQADELSKGMNPRAASAMEMLAAHYGIPSINVAPRIVEMSRAGTLIYVPAKDAAGKEIPAPAGVTLFSNDGVHPLEAGHRIYTNLITEALKQWEATPPKRHTLKPPYIADNWENARLVPLEPAMLSAGWKKLSVTEGLGRQFYPRVPEIWQADKPGEKITFKFKGTAAKLYDLMGPDGAQVVVTLDGKTGAPQPRFDSFSSYHRLATLTIGEGLADTVHTVSIEIYPQQPNRSSVVDVEKDKPGFDAKRYDGTALRVGAILLIGDIVRD